jgi:outer membrane lipoprotein SlyB
MSKPSKAQRAPDSGEDQSVAIPFLVGAVVGGLAGAMLGAALGRQTAGALSTLFNAVDKRAGRPKRDRPRFELLLQ